MTSYSQVSNNYVISNFNFNTCMVHACINLHVMFRFFSHDSVVYHILLNQCMGCKTIMLKRTPQRNAKFCAAMDPSVYI